MGQMEWDKLVRGCGTDQVKLCELARNESRRIGTDWVDGNAFLLLSSGLDSVQWYKGCV